jgi:hypothetical protein
MGVFDSTDAKEKELEGLEIEVDIADKRKELAEKRAIIAQLKRQYGSDWRKVLGVGASSSISTLKSFLRTANTGLREQSRTSLSSRGRGGVSRDMVLVGRGSMPSPLPNRDLRRL